MLFFKENRKKLKLMWGGGTSSRLIKYGWFVLKGAWSLSLTHSEIKLNSRNKTTVRGKLVKGKDELIWAKRCMELSKG
jgi:hypothetical protein